MKAARSEQELQDGYKDYFGKKWNEEPGRFSFFCKSVRWADAHPHKPLRDWMDEVTILNKEIQRLKAENNQLKQEKKWQQKLGLQL